MSTNVVDNLSIKDILNKMSSRGENSYPIMNNPFIDPNYSSEHKNIETDIKNIHRVIKLTASENIYEELAEELRQNAGYGDYDACKVATERLDFLKFCDMKDENGFTAIKYAGDLGYHKIVKLLLDSGAKPDKVGLRDFININIDENDIYQSLETIEEGLDEDNELTKVFDKLPELKPTPTTVPLPTTRAEKKEMLNRLNEIESSLIGKKLNFGIADNIKTRPIHESEINYVEIDEVFEQATPFTPNLKSEAPKKKESGFGASFKKNLAKNFSKTKFSENRYNDKITPPEKTEMTPDEIQEIMKQRNIESFQGKSNEFLEEFSSKDVSKYMMSSEKIQPALKEFRGKMLPSIPVRKDIYDSVKNSLKNQKYILGTKVLNNLVDSIYGIIKFYIDIYHRMVNFDRVEVRPSPIHGNGIFAKRKIQKGDIITFYFPYFLNYDHEKNADIIIPILSRRTFEKDQSSFNNLFKSTIKIPDNFYLMGDDEFISDSRFLGHMANDPCDFKSGSVDSTKYESEILDKANASVVSYTNDRRYIYIGAMRDIEIDEEILVPYGGRYWELDSKST